MSPPYLPIYGIYLPFQVNLYVPNSKPSNKHSVLYARIAHVSTRVVRIFHVRRVILKRSGLRSSLIRKWLVRDAQSHALCKSNQNNSKQNSPTVVSWRHSLFRVSHGLMLVGGGEYKLYHSVWEPPIMCVARRISPSLSCYVDNEGISLKILFISISKPSSDTSTNPCFPLRRAYLFTFMLSHHPLIKKHQLESTAIICIHYY